MPVPEPARAPESLSMERDHGSGTIIAIMLEPEPAIARRAARSRDR
jgi:hypothetical protein